MPDDRLPIYSPQRGNLIHDDVSACAVLDVAISGKAIVLCGLFANEVGA